MYLFNGNMNIPNPSFKFALGPLLSLNVYFETRTQSTQYETGYCVL